MPDATLTRLRALVSESGLSQAEFATRVLGRDPRSLRRYLAGDVIPPTLVAWIDATERIESTRGRVTVTVLR